MFNDYNFRRINREIIKSREKDLLDLPELYFKLHEIKGVKNVMFSSHFSRCPSLDVVNCFGYNFRTNIKLPFVKLIYALKIEKEFTNEECIKILFLNSDYLYGNIGVFKASKYYFNKELNKLSQREKLTLIVMYENPSLYNPIRRPEKVKLKVDLFERMIKNKTN